VLQAYSSGVNPSTQIAMGGCDRRQAAAESGAYNVRVFGSVARGEASSESGLDLLVDLEPIGQAGHDIVGVVPSWIKPVPRWVTTYACPKYVPSLSYSGPRRS
jgi:hypothetical protein